MNKISVIVPIYNVEKYLTACIDSIINQTYQNLEIILVNDGSTDTCTQICNDYAQKEDRIKLIHKQNGGLSDARNAGLSMATGDFVSFVDSDDLLSVNFYEILLTHLLKNDADIVECNFIKFQNETELENIKNPIENEIELYDTEKGLKLLMDEYLKQVVWNKIYRKRLLIEILFPVNKINEDEFWTYKIFGNAKKILKIPNVLYFYRQQESSIMGKQYSLRRLDGLQGLQERIFYMEKNFPNLENQAIKVFCFASTYHYQQLCIYNHLDPDKSIRKKIFESVKRFNKLSIFKNWYWKDIIWYLLFIWFPVIYMKLRDYMELKVQNRLTQQKND